MIRSRSRGGGGWILILHYSGSSNLKLYYDLLYYIKLIKYREFDYFLPFCEIGICK